MTKSCLSQWSVFVWTLISRFKWFWNSLFCLSLKRAIILEKKNKYYLCNIYYYFFFERWNLSIKRFYLYDMAFWLKVFSLLVQNERHLVHLVEPWKMSLEPNCKLMHAKQHSNQPAFVLIKLIPLSLAMFWSYVYIFSPIIILVYIESCKVGQRHGQKLKSTFWKISFFFHTDGDIHLRTLFYIRHLCIYVFMYLCNASFHSLYNFFFFNFCSPHNRMEFIFHDTHPCCVASQLIVQLWV